MSKIHFLNVGHGDCTVIEHNSGRITVIDCNNGDDLDADSEAEILGELPPGSAASFALWRATGISETAALEKVGYNVPLTNPVRFLTDRYRGRAIHRYIQTHPDMDHMRGICALDNAFEIVNLWDAKHVKQIDRFRSDDEKADWLRYQSMRSVPREGLTVLSLHAGAASQYYNRGGNADLGDGLHVLSPTPELVQWVNERDGKWNELSYVLMLKEHGRSLIFGGDAESEAWARILATYAANLKCDILKASHHGRKSGYHGAALRAMNPGLTVVSVGKKNPDHDASASYRAASQYVWSTRWKSDITIDIDASGRMTASNGRDDETLTWKQQAA